MIFYSRSEAANLVEIFEDWLAHNGISVPSPEDDEREKDNMIGLYGSTYYDLLDEVESSVDGFACVTAYGAKENLKVQAEAILLLFDDLCREHGIKMSPEDRLKMRNDLMLALSPEYKKIRNYVDAKRVLSEWCYRVEDLGSCCSRVYYKDGTGDYTALTTCDDVHSGMVEIEGKVQNIYEWVKEGCL